MPARLTTTSYAVLGLLAVRDWSAYDLVGQYERSLRWAWPASRTHLYAEPKKLVDFGLATAATEPGAGPEGRRTVYQITTAGRRALRDWLASPPAAPELNHEVMLRLAFADQSSPEVLLETVHRATAELTSAYRDGVFQIAEYLADGGPFPQRLHLIALASEFHVRLHELLLDWLTLVRTHVEAWSSTKDVGLTPEARALLQDAFTRGSDRLHAGTSSEEIPYL